MLNWIVINRSHLPFNYVQTNDWCLIELLVIHSNHHHHHVVLVAWISWPSLATFPYRSSPLAGLQGYIPYPHIAAECMFVLVVLLLLGHMWGSIRVHHLWARPCFSSSVLHVCSSNLNSFRDRRQVAGQLMSCGVLPPGLVQDCSQHSCVIAV